MLELEIRMYIRVLIVIKDGGLLFCLYEEFRQEVYEIDMKVLLSKTEIQKLDYFKYIVPEALVGIKLEVSVEYDISQNDIKKIWFSAWARIGQLPAVKRHILTGEVSACDGYLEDIMKKINTSDKLQKFKSSQRMDELIEQGDP